MAPEPGTSTAGTRRRVPGLRREEVALSAGISTTYYTKLERGQVGGVSRAVLAGLAGALRLTPQETDYIASIITVPGWGARAVTDLVPPTLQRLLDGMPHLPAHVLNERCDLVAWNSTGRALYPYHFDGDQEPNAVRFLFTDPRARTFFRNWERWSQQGVAFLRSALARHPQDRDLAAFVAELRNTSDEFADGWTRLDAHYDPVGTRTVEHPDVGRLTLDFQELRVAGHPGLRITAYTAPAGSATAARLEQLSHQGTT